MKTLLISLFTVIILGCSKEYDFKATLIVKDFYTQEPLANQANYPKGL